MLEHIQHLTITLQLLQDDNFFVKESKCMFATSRVSYLGHIIQAEIVAPDPDKIQAILLWTKPTSLTTLRAFLGITGFYRKFLRSYATLASPLTNLLIFKVFTWNEEAQKTFLQFKKFLTIAPVLHLPYLSLLFVVETDASNSAIGMVLSQAGHPIAFFSKKLCPKMQNNLVYVKEMLAITKAVKKWRHYLIDTHFQITTDQQSLKRLLTKAFSTLKQQKWAIKLIGYSFDILYHPGRHSQTTDFLSRPPTSVILAIPSPIPEILMQLKNITSEIRETRSVKSHCFSKQCTYLSKRPFVSRPKTICAIHRISAHHHTSRVPCHPLWWTLRC